MNRGPLWIVVLLSSSLVAADRPIEEIDRRRLTAEELKAFRIPKEAQRLTVDALKQAKVLPPDYVPQSGMALPLLFEENRGQVSSRAPFLLRHSGYAARFSANEILTAVGRGTSAEILRMSLAGGRRVEPKGLAPSKATLNVMRGRDRGRWQLRVPLFGGVHYAGIYEAVDFYVTGEDGSFEYGFVVHPRGRPETIRLRIEGAKSLEIDRSGNLVVHLSKGHIVHTRPVSREKTSSGWRELKSEFAVVDRTTVAFKITGRTPGSTLVIDPEIVFSTYYGGQAWEGATATASSGADDHLRRGFDLSVVSPKKLFISGQTTSPDFPATVGEYTANFNGIVLKIDAAANPPQLEWASVFGGFGGTFATAIAALPDQSSYVCGRTSSPDFPPSASPAFRGAREGGGAYVIHIGADGVIDDGTLLGSSALHEPSGIAWDAGTESVYVAGTVLAQNQPVSSDATPDARQRTYAGGIADGFAARFDRQLATLHYFTFLGGTSSDVIRGLAVRDGQAYVTGATSSTDFPTTANAHQRTHSMTAAECPSGTDAAACFDIFVTRIGPNGTELVYSTLYGREGEDYARAIVVDVSGTAHITGADTLGGLSTLIASVAPQGDAVHSTSRLLFQEPGEHGEDITLDRRGKAWTIGTSRPETASLRGNNIFIARRSDGLLGLDEITVFGGNGEDAGYSIGADGKCLYIVGATESTDAEPIRQPLQGENRGGSDLYLAAYCGEVRLFKMVDENQPLSMSFVTFDIVITNTTDDPVSATFEDILPPQFLLVSFEAPFPCPGLRCDVTIPEGVTTIRIRARALDCGPAVNVARLLLEDDETLEAPAPMVVVCPNIPVECGNGRRQIGEECDDGNRTSGDGCRADCTIERCGDSIIDRPRETCDPPGPACAPDCQSQTPAGELCTDRTPPCPDGYVCGRECFVSEDCWISILPPFVGCDTIGWCEEFTCRPPGEDVIEIHRP